MDIMDTDGLPEELWVSKGMLNLINEGRWEYHWILAAFICEVSSVRDLVRLPVVELQKSFKIQSHNGHYSLRLI